MTSTDRPAPPAAAVCFDGPVELDAARVARTHGSPLCLPEPSEMLGVAPGWRFLIAPGYEDVWCDPSLLSQVGRRW
ncbi:hypothetical protein BJF81_13360 [Ornithinimicrobium sp. CNJ-824]|uniref:hypothetical protein n=1 Tax=Ornithinimicrobium sp. CNJ-824 TaxID=1904966 RepID=UPI00095A05F4|nr:hypothetical protein [Ornithinimicrobium sp. CNJ-824]OLT22119.1 hypothetical protein BJF81_13360 [Ornithinimicrobium sp. CNJ-824]